MEELQDPAILVLLLLPSEKARALLLSAISHLRRGLSAGTLEAPHRSGEGAAPGFTVELLSSSALETMLRLWGQSAPVLVLQQAETGAPGGGPGALGEGEEPGATADFRELLATVLAGAETGEAASTQPDAKDLEALSPREMEVLTLLAQGASNQALSESLGITLNTVKSHLKNVMRKLNTRNRGQTALVGKLIFHSSALDWPDAG